MFEGSLVESRGLVGTGTERWTALGSLTLQLAVAGLLLAFPLVRPQILPIINNAPHVELPIPMRPPVVVQPVRAAGTASSGISAPTASAPTTEATQRFFFPRPGTPSNEAEPSFDPNLKMGPGGGGPLAAILGPGMGPGPGVSVVRAPEPKLPQVSGGVAAGMLLAPIQPVYPPIARATRTQGTVVLAAVISKAGRIESLNVVSGPQMLRTAAADAVARARYRPYLLNGQPVDVETLVTVVFTLGS